MSKRQGPSGTKVQSEYLKKPFQGLDNESNYVRRSSKELANGKSLEWQLELSSAKFKYGEFQVVEQEISTEENALNLPPVTFYNDPFDIREQQEIVRLLKECDDHQERRMKLARDNEANTNNKDNNSVVLSECSTDDSSSPNVKIIVAKPNLPSKIARNFEETTTEKLNLPLGGENHELAQTEELTEIILTLKDSIIVINNCPGKTVEVIFDH